MHSAQNLSGKHNGTLIALTLATFLSAPAWSTAHAADSKPGAGSFGRLRIDIGTLIALPDRESIPCPSLLTDTECRSIVASWAHYADIPRLIEDEEDRINLRHDLDISLSYELGYKAATVDVLGERGFSWLHMLGLGGLVAILSGIAGAAIGFALAVGG
jgi:hypothetical protein